MSGLFPARESKEEPGTTDELRMARGNRPKPTPHQIRRHESSVLRTGGLGVADGASLSQSTREGFWEDSLSDLMDLNLSLKFDKTGKQGETRQPKKRSQEPFARGSRDDGGTAADCPLASSRFSATLDRQARHTPARSGAAKGSERSSSPSECYSAEAHPPRTASGELEKAKRDHLDDAPTSLKQAAVDHYDWGVGLYSAMSLLETTQASAVETKVKQPRNLSASATRSRNRQEEPTSSVWESSGGTLQCTGVRAELVSRNGEPGFSNAPLDAMDTEEYPAFAGVHHRRDGSRQLERKAELGRFQWVTNDDGVANFLQRPPSRQKEAFPTHLADVVPYAAFKVEVPMADEEAKQHIEATRKNAVEQTRPPSRHKPPGQSLFLEVRETRRQVPSAFCPSRVAGPGTESCGALPPAILSMEVPDAEASPASRDALGKIFALDRRHDNPDRDGFSVLQLAGVLAMGFSAHQSTPRRVPLSALLFQLEGMRFPSAYSVADPPGALPCAVAAIPPLSLLKAKTAPQ
eukprot:g5356.t2